MFLRSAGCVVLAGIAWFSVAPPAPAQPRDETRSSAKPLRTWTDVTGQFKVRAEFLEIADGKVQLQKEDGSTIAVPLEKLSAADRRWLARQAKRPATEAERPASRESGQASRTAAAGADWPAFRGVYRDGKSPDTGLLKEWPEGGPPLLWKTDILGEGFSSVSVVGGTVYATGEADDVLTLFAFDEAGTLRWKTPHGPAWTESYPGARATPTVDGNRIYLLSGRGLLRCFDAQNGKPVWQRDAAEFGGSPGGWGYAESVLIYGKLAIFKPGGANCIVALDKETGQNVWASRGFQAGPEYSSCLPVEAGGVSMIVTGTNQGIVAVDARGGAMLWSNPFSAGNTANCPTPAFSDGMVFWANGYGKGGICISLAGGRATEAWTTGDMVCHHGGYVIHEGHIYGNNNEGWACLDLKTGRTLWNERLVGKGSVCWADNMLYLFSEDRGRAALATCSPEGVELKGEVQVEGDGPSWAHPVVIGGRLYLRYATNLYCFDVKAK